MNLLQSKPSGKSSLLEKCKIPVEKALKDAVEVAGYDFELNPGEGAFYGPKLEFILKDAIGREWQCGTLQVDFVLPDRLDANYIGEDGEKHRPVMLHRAVLGSFERFIGILLENDYGKLPNWLTPTQVVIMTINDDCLDYAKEIENKLNDIEIRCLLDDRNEKINYKIREHSAMKVPYIVVIGRKEISSNTVSIRELGNEKVKECKTEEFLKNIKNSCRKPKIMSN